MNQLNREDILVRRNCVKETSHGGANSFEVDPIKNTDWDVVETVPNQETAISQLTKGITVQKDVSDKDTD